MTAAALTRVQAHVLRPAHADLTYSAFHFVAIDDQARVRDLLRRLLDEGMTVSDPVARSHRPPEPGGVSDHLHVAVGFTYEGLKRLGLGDAYRANASHVPRHETDPFEQGMAARADLLNDPDTSSWGGAGRHMLLWVADVADGRHRNKVEELVEQSGLGKAHVEDGSHGEGEPEVLGFLDGTSQPFVSELATSTDRLHGGGTVTPAGWRPVPLGEFVLGSTDAGEEHLYPRPAWLTRGGTFVVYRKYRVDREAFDAFLETAGSLYDGVAGRQAGGAATVAGKVLGHYRKGELPPGGPDGYDAVIPPETAPGTVPRGPNDFRYGSDTYGHACPLGSHIRRANPRDALGFDGRLVARHRIIRRGVPWNDGESEGLHFVGVNARILDQFEFIQRQWLNTGTAFRLGNDVDLIAGSPPRTTDEPDEADEPKVRFVIQGRDPVIVTAPHPIAQLEGGDYFLMPGMDGLRQLARGTP